MMDNIIELWQQARLDETRMDSLYREEDLVPMIIKLEKRQQNLLRFKTLSVLILLPAIVILFLNLGTLTPVSILGMGIFTISALVVVVMLNRLRFRITYEERTLSMLRLAGIAEKKIRIEKKLFKIYLPLFVVVALSGFNLMYLDYFIGEEPLTRLLYHLVMTGGLAVAFLVGLSVRIRRFEKQFLPVLERIRKFKSESKSY
jgi:hypothetical protein